MRGANAAPQKSLEKLKDTIRAKTKRNSGGSLKAIIAEVNRTLRGWFEYFKHSHRWTFEPLDVGFDDAFGVSCAADWAFVASDRGLGDSLRWPNAFFTEQGLYNLSNAHALARQSSKR